MPHTTQDIIQQTKRWIKSVVIELDLCPFASQVFIQETIDYVVIEHDSTEPALQQLVLQKLADSFETLNNNKEIETVLLITPEDYDDFDSYLSLLDLGNLLLDDLNYTGIYQLASFHPQYCFEGCEQDDAGNFSNRSPYPMLHILREDSIEKAVDSYDNIEDVPENNIKKLRELGFDTMQKKLNNILQLKF